MRRKKVFLRSGKDSLECRCLRDGSLDVNLITGTVTSYARGKPKAMTLIADRDGYLHIQLYRERPDRRGKALEVRTRSGKIRKRYRESRFVRVNRLVMMKRLAVKAGGSQWREFVKDLPPFDVNHEDLNRANNHHRNLTLMTAGANRGRREMTPEEQAEIDACTF